MSQSKEVGMASKSGESSSEKRSADQPESADSKRSRTEIRALPTRQYLDNTVVPILLDGLAALSKERPGVNVIKLFSFVTDGEARLARGFSLGNPFQSGLRI
jgi:Dpy-30 motif